MSEWEARGATEGSASEWASGEWNEPRALTSGRDDTRVGRHDPGGRPEGGLGVSER